MARMTHEVALADHKYLWSFSPASDMTGGYEDQNDLDRMLEHPTKAMAVKCLTDQIEYWFERGTEDGGKAQVQDLLRTDAKVRAIYQRHVGPLDDETDD